MIKRKRKKEKKGKKKAIPGDRIKRVRTFSKKNNRS